MGKPSVFIRLTGFNLNKHVKMIQVTMFYYVNDNDMISLTKFLLLSTLLRLNLQPIDFTNNKKVLT